MDISEVVTPKGSPKIQMSAVYKVQFKDLTWTFSGLHQSHHSERTHCNDADNKAGDKDFPFGNSF